MTLGKSLCLSEPECSHLSDGDSLACSASSWAWRVRLGPLKDTVWLRERPLGVGDSGQALGKVNVKANFPMAWDVVHW